MKKLIISAAILLLTGVTAFAVNHYQDSDPIINANAAALSGPIIGPSGSNWKDATYECIRVKKTTSTISISIGVIGIGSSDETTITEKFNYDGCGYGTGWCWSSAGCPE